MTYDEAEEKALNMKWVMDTCSQGEECWCRIIKPVEPVKYNNARHGETDWLEEYWIVRPGELNKEVAERIVEDHNIGVAWREALGRSPWESDTVLDKA
jgi:hypothetical protein